MKYVLFLLLGTGLFFSCKYVGGKRINGNGNLVTQDRNISTFDGVESYGSFDVYITPSSETSLKVEAEENLQEYIETVVDDNKLQIRTRRGFNIDPDRGIRIYVSGPMYRTLATYGSGNIITKNAVNENKSVKLAVHGSGNIEAELNTEFAEAEIAGSGTIKVSGSANSFKTSIMGSGDIQAGNLKTDKSSVEIAGSGDVEVFANTTLDVHVMGSGDVRHRGNAKVSSNIAGSGNVSRID